MFTPEQLVQANAMCAGTLMETLGIEFIASSGDEVAATMPVGPPTHQPMGLLHGGATVALAESLGSASSYLLIDQKRQAVVGIEAAGQELLNYPSLSTKGKPILVGRLPAVHEPNSILRCL